MGSLGSIPRYLAGESQNRKNQKSKTHASENRLYRSRIAGNFDTAKSQGATTARTRADGSSLLGLHGHQGDLEEMERTKRTNQKTENSKKKGKWETHQNQKKKKQEIHEKIGNPPKKEEKGGHRSHPRPTNQEPKTHQSKNRKPKEK